MPIRMSGLTSGLDTEAIVNSLMQAQRAKQDKIKGKQQKLEWKKEIWSSLNTKIYGFYKGSLSKMKFQSSYNSKTASSTDTTKVKVTASNQAASGSYSVKIKSIASAQNVTSGQVKAANDAPVDVNTKLVDLKPSDGGNSMLGKKITISSGGKTSELEVGEDTTINDFLTSCKDIGLNASYDTTQKRFFISSAETGVENKFTISIEGESDKGDAALKALGLAHIDGADVVETDKVNSMVVKAAKDSEIEFNGATLTSTTTDMTVAGITLNLLKETGEDTVNIVVTNDTDGVYDSIKEFITEYNSVLKEMNTKYNADSAKDYDVLTDDQKSEMSDDDVEKWNNKIKDSLLRRDSTLEGIKSTFRTTLMGSVKASNGKTYSLANLGITTSTDYKEGGLLHIKGDEDDSVYSDSDNTLKKMIEEDPDTVREVMTGLLNNLYTELGKKMRSTDLSSALTFYNDKEMDKQIAAYKKDVSNWEKKLTDMENRYYSQFTAMEKAMSNMQSQQNYVSSMMGNS